jgi:hypothetical protein
MSNIICVKILPRAKARCKICADNVTHIKISNKLTPFINYFYSNRTYTVNFWYLFVYNERYMFVYNERYLLVYNERYLFVYNERYLLVYSERYLFVYNERYLFVYNERYLFIFGQYGSKLYNHGGKLTKLLISHKTQNIFQYFIMNVSLR